MSSILDPHGNPIQRATWSIWWKRHFTNVRLIWGSILAVIASTGLILTQIKPVFQFFSSQSIVFKPAKYISEIPAYQMPVSGSIDSGPIEIAGLVFHHEKQTLDLRIRNVSNSPSVINQIAMRISFSPYAPIVSPLPPDELPVSGSFDLSISQDEMREAKEMKKSFKWEKGFNVAYVVPPKDADRYVFTFKIDQNDLYKPVIPGEYGFYIYLRVDNSFELVEYTPLDELLSGTPTQSTRAGAP